MCRRSGASRALIAAVACAAVTTACAEVDWFACETAAAARDPQAPAVCERLWLQTGDEAAAVRGALSALHTADEVSLRRLASRAWPTVEGARILHMWGELQRKRGDFAGAEASLRQALALRIDRDPLRAMNDALSLVVLLQSSRPADEAIAMARLAWQQAVRASATWPQARAFAAGALVDLFIDLGELEAAEAVFEDSALRSAGPLKYLAQGRIELARGHHAVAIRLFERAVDANPMDPESSFPLPAILALIQAQLEAGDREAARRRLDWALAQPELAVTADDVARFAAVEAAVLLGEGKIDAAIERVERGLAPGPRDAARLMLLNVRGDALARRGDPVAAEAAWRDAADSVEAWRASIPTMQLRGGLIMRHRRALEAWLDSSGERGNVDGALEVTRRMVGRGLLDRIRHREADAPASVDASLRDVADRLSVRRELVATSAGARDLREFTGDVVTVMTGLRSVWAIARSRGQWSIRRVGERRIVEALVDGYRAAIDDPVPAAQLGAAMFPVKGLPAAGAPLLVMLDRALSDVALPGLRVAGRFLIERVELIEVLAPDLLFAPLPSDQAWGPPVVLGDAQRNLPRAAYEAEAAARALGVDARLGAAATRGALIAARRARVLHVATHSQLEDGRAAFRLADGAFNTHDLVESRVAPRLAVIATCRSQVDDEPATSLVAALLAAGTPGVVGVKRAADDEALALLMMRFYEEGGSDDPVRGLARAQRAAISAGRLPRTWATVSFFGVGAWSRVKGRSP